MKAITIREPWASMIADGKKMIEVRTWKTRHRGKLLLCAGKRKPGPLAGLAFAVADLADVRPLRPSDRNKTGGIFIPGAYAWVLSNIKKIQPFPARGWPGIFDHPIN